jgi:L-amino acid N-acyltransferase YncA
VKRHSTTALHSLGFRRLYSRVWYSHAASIAMNEAAGWNRVALVVEVFPFGRKKPWRVTVRRYG